MANKQFWDEIYTTKQEKETSWFQPYPKTSMDFIALFQLPITANIIDIGGGDSHFVDVLLDKGYLNIWVLDISAAAIEKAKKRVGSRAHLVHWIITDVTDFMPPVNFDFWHDRAAFHFLTAPHKAQQYVSIAEKAIQKNGYLILGTFSEDGPTKCSGLDVQQYSAASMSARFDSSFDRIKCVLEAHQTPFNTIQQFLFCSFSKK